LLAGALPIAAMAGSTTPAAHTVTIETMSFGAKQLTVRRGDRIVWTNKDLVPHTVTSEAKAFDSGVIAPNASWSYVATESGTYPYVCIYHPTMKALLRVLP
jgi:plastocyanin